MSKLESKISKADNLMFKLTLKIIDNDEFGGIGLIKHYMLEHAKEDVVMYAKQNFARMLDTNWPWAVSS